MDIDPGQRDDEQKKKQPYQHPISNQDLRVSQDADVLKTGPQPRPDLVTPPRFQCPLVLISRLINFPTSSILNPSCSTSS